jgi:ABC-type dipeptide/oligopeptide/nickel transport system permease component
MVLIFLAKKLMYGSLVMVGVVIIVFFLFQGIGDPARLILGQTGDAATIENIRRELYLDQPKSRQLLLYINDISPVGFHSREEIKSKGLRGFFIGNNNTIGLKIPYLRRSYQSKKEVWSILMEALPGTLLLAIAAMMIAISLGIPLGIKAAVEKDTWVDRTAIISGVAGISAPSFFMGILIAYLFGFILSRYTGLHMTGSLFDQDPYSGSTIQLQNLILPAITLGIRPLAIITQLTRSSMLDTLSKDFIRTARAKGLTERAVIWRHAFPNAVNPVLTAITGWFAELLAGAFFVEYIFGWKGIGKTTVDALEKLDYPVVMGSILLTAGIFVLVNIIADLLYTVADPRIKLR